MATRAEAAIGARLGAGRRRVVDAFSVSLPLLAGTAVMAMALTLALPRGPRVTPAAS